MSKFNFDSGFFRRVIADNKESNKIPGVTQLVREAVEVFYDEYDYYPTLAAYAPGTLTIMGDHLEYVKGNLVQCGLPLATVFVGETIYNVKCKMYTMSNDVKGMKKSIFPIPQYRKSFKVFPEWVNYIKGVLNCFPHQNVTGCDAVIHSSIPIGKGLGSSAALQVGFYTFLEESVGKKLNDIGRKKRKAKLCQAAESLSNSGQSKLGEWNNFTAAMAEKKSGVLINCRTEEVTVFEMRETDILFLIIIPNFELEKKDRNLVTKRQLELKLAAKLLNLEEIIDATPAHLEAFEMMEDPALETVEEILRSFDADELIIEQLLNELFIEPEIESGSVELLDEEYSEKNQKLSISIKEKEDEESEKPEEFLGEAEKVVLPRKPCIPQKGGKFKDRIIIPKQASVSYIHKKIAELCEKSKGLEMKLPNRVCREVQCTGYYDTWSVDSNLTLCDKLLKRVRHVITENLRSLELPDIIKRLDYEEFGVKLIQSHLSLKLDFDVSCPTLDSLVELAIDADSVYGAKMMSGGGVLVLLHRRVLESFIQQVTGKFGDRFQFYSVFPSAGAERTNIGMRLNPKSNLCKPFLNRDELLKSAVEHFEATYNYRPTHGAFAPGVAQLMGEHTDYNHGITLAVGVNMLTVIVGAHNGTSKVRATTTTAVEGDPQKVIFSLPEGEAELFPGKVKWARYIKGVIAHFKGSLKGFDCMISTSVPCSIGMGSKAALVSTFYTFLEELSGEYTSNLTEKAHSCMLASHEFSSILTGISEVTASIKSKKERVCYIDCRTAVTSFLPASNPSLTYVLMLTNMYATDNKFLFCKRMEECFEVARALGAKTLRCLTMNQLNTLRNSESNNISEKKLRRAQHVIQENERVLRAAEALKNADYEAFGELMVASHNSLRDNYEVIHPELDMLVKLAMEVDGVLGSKMLSTGFRLSTISLVKLWAVDDLIDYLQKNSKCDIESYRVNSSNGSCGLDVKGYVQSLPSPQFVFEDIFPF